MDRHLSPEHDGSALNKIDMQGDPDSTSSDRANPVAG
jgi:hypothetical protein